MPDGGRHGETLVAVDVPDDLYPVGTDRTSGPRLEAGPDDRRRRPASSAALQNAMSYTTSIRHRV
jgi:hypothetical protein